MPLSHTVTSRELVLQVPIHNQPNADLSLGEDPLINANNLRKVAWHLPQLRNKYKQKIVYKIWTEILCIMRIDKTKLPSKLK